MAYSPESMALRKPPLSELPRFDDRTSFLFLDRARVVQARTGVDALMETDGQMLRVPVPFAGLAVLFLGPGCSISTPALTSLARHGTTVVIGSADEMTAYAAVRPLASSSGRALAQARVVSDPFLRIAAARQMYLDRFPGSLVPQDASLKVLRGLEGARVKEAYKALARQHGVTGFRRVTEGATDPVNVALNACNSVLYGVALGACQALGLHPGLGVIHQGSSSALLFDLADNFKALTSFPAAFSACRDGDPVRSSLTALRKAMSRHRVLPRMVALADTLFPMKDFEDQVGDLLLDDAGFVPGHTNWALA